MQNIQSGNIIYLTGEGHSEELSGVNYNGVLYYDMSNVRFINNSGVADLIGLVKDWLDQGTEVRFINVNNKIKNKIREIDLDNILYCDE